MNRIEEYEALLKELETTPENLESTVEKALKRENTFQKKRRILVSSAGSLAACFAADYRYKPLSPYAAVKRDLALVCDEAVACGDIEETIRKASPLITEVKLFDIYRGANLGEGKKSMAFSLTLSDPAAEVSNEQVERTVKKVLGNLKFKLGIEIR